MEVPELALALAFSVLENQPFRALFIADRRSCRRSADAWRWLALAQGSSGRRNRAGDAEGRPRSQTRGFGRRFRPLRAAGLSVCLEGLSGGERRPAGRVGGLRSVIWHSRTATAMTNNSRKPRECVDESRRDGTCDSRRAVADERLCIYCRTGLQAGVCACEVYCRIHYQAFAGTVAVARDGVVRPSGIDKDANESAREGARREI